MLTGDMAQVASVVIVLVAAGLNVWALAAGIRGRQDRPLLLRFVRGMVFTSIAVTLLLPFLNLPTQSTILLLPVLILGSAVAAGVGLLNGARAGAARVPRAPGTAGSVKPTPDQRSAEPYPWLESPLQAPGVGTTEWAIARLPLPFHKAGHPPLPSEAAEAWFERQEARLGAALQGKDLAAARLRLSTVKSMLLLGYLTVAEADKDVSVVMREGRRS